MRYKTEDEIFDIVRRFEDGTISREEWHHAEHLTVALYYIYHTAELSDAHEKMRSGIFNYLKAINVDLSKETPYHETITLFWMRAISDFLTSKNGNSIVDLTNELLENGADKNLPLKFYSRELLFSDRARAEFVAPDLKEF
jgi:hypothetical protein